MLDPELDRIVRIPHHERPRSRRDFLLRGGAGFGALALVDLLRGEATAEPGDSAERQALLAPLKPKATHFPATARCCIFLFMEGGPSHIDLFDPKPLLNTL